MAEIAFIDSETRSLCDVTVHGTILHARHPSTECTVWGFAFDDEPLGGVWSPGWAWSHDGVTDLLPNRLIKHVESGGYVVAWNSFFDRHVWNEVMVKKYGWPRLEVEQVLCAMAQAEGNNLPAKLEKACEALDLPFKKDPRGAQLMAQLAVGTRDDWKKDVHGTPEKMGVFRSYCLSDVLGMRSAWQHTRPLTLTEWRDFHASERINDRGQAVDRDFALAATRYAQAEEIDVNRRLYEVTNDRACTITNHVRKARWLHDQLWPAPELQAAVARPEKEKGKGRYSADRATREYLLEALTQPELAELFKDEHLERVLGFLEAVEAGNSAAVRKFATIANQAVPHADHYRVHGGYIFNGAGQTGRFSSRGVQRHNLTRDSVDPKDRNRDVDAIEDILAGATPEALAEVYELPVSRLLSRLTRPTFVAAPGKTLVWSDWEQIEARALPWLANSEAGEAKLDLYRAGEDVYRHTARDLLGLPSLEHVTPALRQAAGKVPELSLGFGGAVGALLAMSRAYGVTLTLAQARSHVDRWRAANPWARAFWDALWEAAMGAFRNPGVWHRAGRVRYLFHPTLMYGTLIGELPGGRWIVYPQFKHELVRVVKKDEGTGLDVETTKWRTTYVKGFSGGSARVELWYGVLAENATQGFCATVMRRALTALEFDTGIDALGMDVVMHTHDEIVLEVADHPAPIASAKRALTSVMLHLADYMDGLPLAVDVSHGPFYSKGKIAHGA